MAERYTTIWRLDGMRYYESSPVLLSAGALLLDTLSRSLLVQLKFINLSPRVLRAMSISVHPLNSAGEEIWDAVEYTYEGLDCARDDSFGKTTAIIMPDSAVRSFYVQIRELTFEGGEVWDGSECRFEKLSAPKTLETALGNDDVAHQFKISYGSDCIYMPQEDADLWFCTCGAINRLDEAKCHRCRRVYSALKSINLASLRSENSRRLESEKHYEKKDKEKSSEKHSKIRKLLLILLPSALIAIVAIALIAGKVARNSAFSRAEELLNAGMYDEAANAFRQLGDYQGSDELAAHEVPYRKAMYVMQCAGSENTDALVMLNLKRSEIPEDETVATVLYREAAEMFRELGDYRESAELARKSDQAIDSIRLAALENRYRSASDLLDAKNYCEARDAFRSLGDYKDSSSMADESIYRMASSLSALTEKYSMQGVYCRLSVVTGEKNVFYIPQEVFKELGGGISSDIRALFSSNGVEINFEDPPKDGEQKPFPDALRELFASLGDYKDSAGNATPPTKKGKGASVPDPAGSDSAIFFAYCASGDLTSAYQWLVDNKSKFDSGDMWMNILNMYIPFCGTWSFEQGDPVLISSTINIALPCNSFTSVVKVSEGGSAKLCICPEGNAEYAFELNSDVTDDGSICFSLSPDGVHIYYAVINKIGQFNYSKYNIYALTQNHDSCSYVKG